MPLYTAKCKECDFKEELLFKSFQDRPEIIEICPECGGEREWIFGTCHARFCAPGFAGNDYKIEREMAENERIMAEPIEPGEIRAADDMLKEREKDLGLPEGRLTGKRKKSKLTKEAKEEGKKYKGPIEVRPKKKSKKVKKLEKGWS